MIDNSDSREVQVLREVTIKRGELKPGDLFRTEGNGTYNLIEGDTTESKVVILRLHAMSPIRQHTQEGADK